MEIDKSILLKTKELLGITEDFSPKNLYEILFDYRNKLHPDKYEHDVELKKVVEEKCKLCNNYLDDLERLIQRESILVEPMQLVKYEAKPNEVDVFGLKVEIVKKDSEIVQLKSKIDTLEYRVKNLSQELETQRDLNIEKRTEELINQYKPSKKIWISYSIIFVLTLLVSVISKIDTVSYYLQKYWIFDKNIFNLIMLIIIILIPIIFGIKSFKEQTIEKFAMKVKTPYFITLFHKYLVENEKENIFNECDVFDFISNNLRKGNLIYRFFNLKLLNIITVVTIDGLKDIFIHNLLKKQFIIASSVDKLDQEFRVREKGKYYF